MQLKIEDSKNYAESCVILHWSMTNVLSRFKRLNDFPHVLKRFFPLTFLPRDAMLALYVL